MILFSTLDSQIFSKWFETKISNFLTKQSLFINIMHPYGINIYLFKKKVSWPLWTMNASVPIHWNCTKTATNIILQNFICYVPQKKIKSYRFFNNTWVSKWWQTFHFLFLLKSAWFINRNRHKCVNYKADQSMMTSTNIRLCYIFFPPADLSADCARIIPSHGTLGSHLNHTSPFHQLSNWKI